MHLRIPLVAGFRVTVAPTVWSTHTHHNGVSLYSYSNSAEHPRTSGVSPYSPPLSFKEPLRLILTYREHMKIPPPGLGIISIQRYLKQLPKLGETKTKDLKYYLNIQTGPQSTKPYYYLKITKSKIINVSTSNLTASLHSIP